MKAAKRSTSKGSKKRGRPRQQDAARTESGQISRAKNPSEAIDRLARETRMRHYGLKRSDANQPEAGSVIGRMKMMGDISSAQYDAFVRYQMMVERYRMALQVPDSLKTRRGGVMNVAPDEADEDAVKAWDRFVEFIRKAQKLEAVNLMAPLNYIVSRDEHHPHLVGDLRVVGNVLCRFYGIDHMRKSA